MLLLYLLKKLLIFYSVLWLNNRNTLIKWLVLFIVVVIGENLWLRWLALLLVQLLVRIASNFQPLRRSLMRQCDSGIHGSTSLTAITSSVHRIMLSNYVRFNMLLATWKWYILKCNLESCLSHAFQFFASIMTLNQQLLLHLFKVSPSLFSLLDML